MQLQIVIPVKRVTFTRTAAAALAALASVAVMWLAFGWIGALVLAALLTWLGRLLVRAARGQ